MRDDEQSVSISAQRGLLAGRFQPFHNGHMAAIDDALAVVPELIVAVAAIEVNLTTKNPFTCRERLEMIWRSLGGSYRTRCMLMPLPDNINNALWLRYAQQYLPHFSLAFTNNPIQAIIMKTYNVPARPIAYMARQQLQGSVIRSLLSAGDARWRGLVPNGSLSMLDEIGAEERLASLDRETELH